MSSRPVQPIGGHVSAESQTPLYYLRHQHNQPGDLRGGAGGGPNTTGSGVGGGGGSGAAVGLISMEEGRRRQLRAEHPTYNEFMIDMTLYQEQQNAREAHRKQREAVERQKERRLVARLKEVDTLMSLPSLRDANGNPAPVDKKAMAWLQQYHPQLADQFNRLIRLSVSVVDSTQQRNVQTDEEVEGKVLAKEAELKLKSDEHEKLRLKERQLRVDRLEWFRTEYEKRRSKAEVARGAMVQASATETLTESRKRLEAAAMRRGQHLESISDTVQQHLMERSLRQSNHQHDVLCEETKPAVYTSRSTGGSATRAEEVAEAARQRNESREVNHSARMTSVITHDKERVDALRQAQVDAAKKMDVLASDRKALTSYHHAAHATHAKEVMGRCVESLDAALKHKHSALKDTEKRLDAAAHRREAASAVVAERARDTASYVYEGGDAASSSRGGNGEDSPRYARSTGNLSPRSSAANMSRSGKQIDSGTSAALSPHQQRRDECRAKANDISREKYASGLAAIDRADKDVQDATKRRNEFMDDVAQHHQVRAKHETTVRARHQQQLVDENAQRLLKLDVEDDKVRVFVPQPPRLYRGMKIPVEKQHVSPYRLPRPTMEAEARAAEAKRRKEFDEHQREVSERFHAAQISRRHQIAEDHHQQLHRETTADDARREYLRTLQSDVKAVASPRHRAAEQRVDAALQERLDRTYDHSQLSMVSTRRTEVQQSESARSHASTASKLQVAEARREELLRAEEARVLMDVHCREEKHRNMFAIDK